MSVGGDHIANHHTNARRHKLQSRKKGAKLDPLVEVASGGAESGLCLKGRSVFVEQHGQWAAVEVFRRDNLCPCKRIAFWQNADAFKVKISLPN